jgi:putative heme-binding domain-containing protein
MEATKEFAQEYETATVVTSDGKEIKGTTLNEDDFSVQIIDQSDRLHFFEKDKLRSFTKSRSSLMPPSKSSLLSDSDLQDIIAYLISVAQ